jgi:uncharacterized protein YjbI with pentapeptide repeats
MVCWHGAKCACPLILENILDKDLAMNRKLGLAVIAFGFACAVPTLAFDADHLAKVKAGEDCIGCDLSEANLSVAYLSGADLTDANLDGAYLSGAYLFGAKMRGAILCNTIVSDGSVIYSGC